MANILARPRAEAPVINKRAVSLSQRRLMWRRFRRHRLAMLSALFLIPIYIGTLFVEFIAPFSAEASRSTYVYAPPQTLNLFQRTENGSLYLRPM